MCCFEVTLLQSDQKKVPCCCEHAVNVFFLLHAVAIHPFVFLSPSRSHFRVTQVIVVWYR